MGQSDSSFQIVIAIDFGTSRSGYAYAFTDDRKIVGQTKWPGEFSAYPKTLTRLLYTPDGKVDSWGYAALWRLAELRKAQNALEYLHFSNFKMALHEEKDRTTEGPRLTRNGKQILVVDLIADYLRCMKDFALADVNRATAGYLKEKAIRWCLTVPAIWTDSDKQLMRSAARKAGLIGAESSEDERLWLVLEPEAAAVYCQQRNASELALGTRFMVIDCGGGTVDITVHQVSDNKGLRELAAGTGGPHGSTYVDATFIDHLRKKLGDNVIVDFHEREPTEYLEMMGDWERIKCQYDPSTTTRVYFPIRPRLYKILSQQHPEVLNALAGEQGEDDKIYFDRETMKAIFQPTLDNIARKVDEQFSRLDGNGCDIIFLVGGFSTSPLLQERISGEFGARVKKIVTPPVPGSAIVEGAVSFGLDPSVRSRRSRLTYGCNSRFEFEPGIDPESKKVWDAERAQWRCEDRFSVFVTAGEEVEVQKSVMRSYVPVYSEQKSMTFKFCATRKKQVRYIDEPEVERIGDLTVQMDGYGLDRSVEVTMYFGGTEIKVEAKDPVSGRKFNTSLRFSSTYSPELIGS